MTRKKTLILIIITVFIFVLVSKNNSNAPYEPNFITANPLDLTQTLSISSFRSCAGHDYSPSDEELRSMKHYITPTQELDQSSGQVKAFAPFDGIISSIYTDSGSGHTSHGVQVWLEPNSAPNWHFLFFHIDLINGLKKGSTIQSGQLIGYANLQGAANFDIGIKASSPMKGPNIFDSPFTHMTKEVLSAYSAVGITQENIVLTKDFRDANPCPIIPGTERERDTRFNPRPEDWIQLKPNAS